MPPIPSANRSSFRIGRGARPRPNERPSPNESPRCGGRVRRWGRSGGASRRMDMRFRNRTWLVFCVREGSRGWGNAGSLPALASEPRMVPKCLRLRMSESGHSNRDGMCRPKSPACFLVVFATRPCVWVRLPRVEHPFGFLPALRVSFVRGEVLGHRGDVPVGATRPAGSMRTFDAN